MNSEIAGKVAERLRKNENVSESRVFELEDKVVDLLQQSGVADKLQGLSDEQAGVFVDGVVCLYKIDLLGRNVETQDKEKLIGSQQSGESANTTFKKVVQERQAETGRAHHGFKEWLPESVKCLGLAVTDTDPETMRFHKEGVMAFPDGYIKRLKYDGDFYKDVLEKTYPAAERVSMTGYVDNERNGVLAEMNNIFHNKLGETVSHLKPPIAASA